MTSWRSSEFEQDVQKQIVLRYLTSTFPYMHNGVYFVLEEVVEFYDEGGGDDPQKSPLMKPLGLSEATSPE